MSFRKVVTLVSVPTAIGVLLLVAGFYAGYAGYSEPLLYAMFGFAIVFILAGMVKNPKLVRKGAKVSSLWLSMSRKLFIFNSIVALLYLLSPTLADMVFFGIAFHTVMVGLAFATLIAATMLVIDRYMV